MNSMLLTTPVGKSSAQRDQTSAVPQANALQDYRMLAISVGKDWNLASFDWVGTGGVVRAVLCRHIESFSTRPAMPWFVTERRIRAEGPQRAISEVVNSIRIHFGLTITDLAGVLNVERPTIYSWLKDASEPSGLNRARIMAVARLADAWAAAAGSNQRPQLNGVVDRGLTLLEWLRVPILSEQTLTAHLMAEGKKKFQNVPVLDYAALAHAASIPESSPSDFDTATGRPLGPEL